jgi:hypothetical protein
MLHDLEHGLTSWSVDVDPWRLLEALADRSRRRRHPRRHRSNAAWLTSEHDLGAAHLVEPGEPGFAPCRQGDGGCIHFSGGTSLIETIVNSGA